MISYISKKSGIKDDHFVSVEEIACLSTDTKPTDVSNGSICIEMDTGSIYMFDEEGEEWNKIN